MLKVTPDQIVQSSESSVAVRNAIKFLGALNEGRKLEVTPSAFTVTKDLIFIFTVFRHKEGRTGLIRIKINVKLCGWIKILVEKYDRK